MDDNIYNIGYTNADGDYNEFSITNICRSKEYGSGYFMAECVDEDGDGEGFLRTFKMTRVKFASSDDRQAIARYAYCDDDEDYGYKRRYSRYDYDDEDEREDDDWGYDRDRENWYAMTDGMYGEMPEGFDGDFEFMGR